MEQTLGEVIDKIFTPATSLAYGDIVLALFVTLVLAMFIYFIYRKTFSGVLYSKNFNVTLVVVSLIVCVIMMGISRNLALSLGLIGALSIVRFRNAIKDPKDVAFLFWAISIGIINGVQFYKLSVTSTVFVGIVLVVLSRKIVINHPYLLILKYKDEIDEKNVIRVLDKYCSKRQVRNRTLTDEENELTIEIKIKDKNHAPLLQAIKKLVKKVTMISYTGDLHE